jgi:hypothetical protein
MIVIKPRAAQKKMRSARNQQTPVAIAPQRPGKLSIDAAQLSAERLQLLSG